MATASPPQPFTEKRGPLTQALTLLAGTPDDATDIDSRLEVIAQLAADRVIAADYASITVLRDDTYITVATSSRLAENVDEAQYADRAGPCLQALADGESVAVPDISTTMIWPGFHQAAVELGLHASLSIPLFIGSGAPVAVLNLYGRDAVAMAPLIAEVSAIFEPGDMPRGDAGPGPLDPGAADLLIGFAEALAIRATIQFAVSTVAARTRVPAAQAYLKLRLHAAEIGVSLTAAAGMIVAPGLAPGTAAAAPSDPEDDA